MVTNVRPTVRPVAESDLDALRAFPDADKVDGTFAATGRDEAIWAVAEIDGEVVASAVLDLVSDLRPEVKRIWVPRAQRRRGLGSAVCGFLEERARQLGHSACHMAIDPENRMAIPMAIDLGYSVTGDHWFVENLDEVHQDSTGAPMSGTNLAIYRKSLTMN